MWYVRRPKPVKAEVWISPNRTPIKGVTRYCGAELACDSCDAAMYMHGVFYAGQEECHVCPGKYVLTDEDGEMTTIDLVDFINDYQQRPRP